MFYWKFPVPSVLKLMTIIAAMVVVSTFITLFYKVSVHSLASCGIIGMLLPLNNASETGMLLYPTIGATVVAGMVMSSRLQLDAHNLKEVTVGAVTGLVIGFVGMISLF